MQKYAKDNNYCKVRDYCHYIGKYRGVAHSICNLKYTVPNEFCVVFQNRSNYDYHFIANEFKLQFEYLGEKTKSKKLFLFQQNLQKVDKNGEKNLTISYNIKFVDSARFMISSLSNIVDNLAEGIHKIKSKGCDCFLNTKV